jgi:hypothetical protein
MLEEAKALWAVVPLMMMMMMMLFDYTESTSHSSIFFYFLKTSRVVWLTLLLRISGGPELKSLPEDVLS